MTDKLDVLKMFAKFINGIWPSALKCLIAVKDRLEVLSKMPDTLFILVLGKQDRLTLEHTLQEFW